MGFMQSASDGGDFKVYVKYNAKAGRWYTKEDKEGAEEFEVTDMTAVFDFENLKTGWFLFAPGVAPVKQLNEQMRHWAPKPNPDFKQGFQVNVFSQKNLLGLREFASTAGAVIDAMNAVYDDYADAPESKTGKLPVVRCVSVNPIVSKHGTNFSPGLQIVSWVDRPAEFNETTPEPGNADPRPLEPVGGGAGGPRAFDTDLDDDVPFASSDPALERRVR